MFYVQQNETSSVDKSGLVSQSGEAFAHEISSVILLKI